MLVILTRCLRCSLSWPCAVAPHATTPDPKSDLHKGIIPRLVEAIFQGIEDADSGIEFTVKLSYVEIYSERVRDLLTARNSGSDNLKIREGTHGGVYIEGVTETYVNSVEQILSLMDDGQRNRAVASTNMNETSSRSHSVFILTLGQLDQNSGSKKGAKLTLVDCECIFLLCTCTRAVPAAAGASRMRIGGGASGRMGGRASGSTYAHGAQRNANATQPVRVWRRAHAPPLLRSARTPALFVLRQWPEVRKSARRARRARRWMRRSQSVS